MASSLLALLDDITTVLDDISVMTKVAAKKTAGVLGDDLALNAQQVTGVHASRELPVVWAVAKGSLVNKAILVPAALVISAVAPWAITPLLILGGAFLCFEGVEKLAHKLKHRDGDGGGERVVAVSPLAPADVEREKVRGAIRTDFILSAEIVVITLGTVASEPFGKRLGVLVAIALLMTVGVYGLVAGIVKLDDAGLALASRKERAAKLLGRAIIFSAPWLMRFLSVAGTAAMFLVGGGILTHGIGFLHHLSDSLVAGLGVPYDTIVAVVFDGVVGIVLGVVALVLVMLVKRVIGARTAN